MKKVFKYGKIYSRISLTMFLIAVLFVSYAMWHPEAGFSEVSAEMTWLFYRSYVAIMVLFAVLSLISVAVSCITK